MKQLNRLSHNPLHYCSSCLDELEVGFSPKERKLSLRCGFCKTSILIFLDGRYQESDAAEVLEHWESAPHSDECTCTLCNWLRSPFASALQKDLDAKLQNLKRKTDEYELRNKMETKVDYKSPKEFKRTQFNLLPHRKPMLDYAEVAPLVRGEKIKDSSGAMIPRNSGVPWSHKKNKLYHLFKEWAHKKTNNPMMPKNAAKMVGFVSWGKTNYGALYAQDFRLIGDIIDDVSYAVRTKFEMYLRRIVNPEWVKSHLTRDEILTHNHEVWRMVVGQCGDCPPFDDPIKPPNGLVIPKSKIDPKKDIELPQYISYSNYIPVTIDDSSDDSFEIKEIHPKEPTHLCGLWSCFRIK